MDPNAAFPSTVYVYPCSVRVSCPSCRLEVSGFIGDPRGASDMECEACGNHFSVPDDAQVVIE